ncbi:MAG: phenylalanine--tRNA ligase subunit alpha [Gemmatimonadetes bacterium]|jgi:phenylalanyl-tRNA synthetase alpha chain|nr:phenylalanine--tRNA ligase subunit alpha [Gemmatimonadota bacterium]MBT6143863.1 phenylalanine--tRNA ligase subunit alpha [Gemmatimonadota bacterium]MBT7860429.1 phenylalanine--tRNA ligase subunit alpha [Gemmatimonadota bacterium]
MVHEIDDLRRVAIETIGDAADLKVLEDLRVQYMGRRSRLREILSGIGKLSAEERPVVGQAAGQAQREIETALTRQQEVLQAQAEIAEAFDVTLPGRRPHRGHKHPLTAMTDELVDVLRSMGFSVADGPEVEDEFHNFDALNTPPDHPARDEQDTFYLDDGHLLRTQTSTVQIRTMQKQAPPLRIISPGRTYRNETVDATHHMVFHQIEGLYVDEGVSLAELKGTLTTMGRRIMGDRTQIRFRPHFFPFTEPSVEFDFSCTICNGQGKVDDSRCRVCKGTGWIEIGGAGMVDPNVFRAVGYDAEKYSGFAFGFGVERVAMIRYGIDDIRLFLESDLRFTRQFGG